MDISLNHPRTFLSRHHAAPHRPIVWRLLLLILLLLFPASALQAQEMGESVTRHGTVNDDIYLAGATVNLSVVAQGDVVVAGGNLTIGDEIKGDVMLAGGSVTIRGKVRDDVRAAGGSLTLDAEVGDDALMAGGNVTLTPATRINGRAWLAGGRVEVAGLIGKELRAVGGRVVVNGEVMGDAFLAAENIDLQPGAVIRGNLRYMSPKVAVIDKAAKISGTITRAPYPEHEHGAAGAAAAGVGFLISLMVTGIVLLLLFPRFSASVTGRIAQAPWISLGLGLAVLTATPLIIILLFVSLVGLWLGLILLATYLIALLGAYLSGALTVGEFVLKRYRRKKAITRGWRVAALVITLAVAAVLGLVPVLGGLILFALLLFGLGGLSWQIYHAIAAK